MKKKTAAARIAPRRSPARKSAAARASGRREGPSGARLESILNEVTGQDARQVEERKLEHWGAVQCPYCGESFEIHVEAAEDGQTMYEDCHVCCKPVSVYIHVEDNEVQISAYRS